MKTLGIIAANSGTLLFIAGDDGRHYTSRDIPHDWRGLNIVHCVVRFTVASPGRATDLEFVTKAELAA